MTEQEIIKGCIQKKVNCQRLLFDQYAGRLMTVCLRYACDTPEAEDMLQEAFILIFSNIQQYRSAGAFEGWLKRVTVNICLRLLQKRKAQFRDSENIEHITAVVQPQALANLTADEMTKMISKLPDGYRTVFNLYIMEGYTHDEIAAMLHIEAATSRSQLMKARRMLQQQILLQQKIAI